MIEFAEGVTLVANGLRWTVAGAMNLANHGGDYSNGLLFVNFNQDCSSLSVGTKKGYRLFSLNSVTDGIEEIYYNDKEEVCIVERLFSSSLIAVVTLASPRKLKVRHFKKGTEICSYSYSNSILSVRMNRQRLVVCLEEAIYIHNIRDMKLLHTIKDTPPNPAGLCALSSNSDNCFLAYPGASHTGEVQIFETVAMQAKMMIPAHDGPLAALSFNASGTKLATASEKGTVIRVFSVVDGAKLFEFRRGVKRCVSIYSLAFSPDSLFLSASSNTETVHIFKLEQVKEGPQSGVDLNSATDANSGGWVSWMKQTLTASASYLPTQVAEVFSQGRDFATVHLPFVNVRNICAFIAVHKVLRLMVASADGVLYIYNVDTNMGGDCILVKQHKFDAVGDKINPHGLQMYGPGGAMDQSYANILRGPVKTECVMTGQDACHDAERYRELGAAAEAPPPAILRLNDEEEFPPVSAPIAD